MNIRFLELKTEHQIQFIWRYYQRVSNHLQLRWESSFIDINY